MYVSRAMATCTDHVYEDDVQQAAAEAQRYIDLVAVQYPRYGQCRRARTGRGSQRRLSASVSVLLLSPHTRVNTATSPISSETLAVPTADDWRLTRFHDILDFKQQPARVFYEAKRLVYLERTWKNAEEDGKARQGAALSGTGCP